MLMPCRLRFPSAPIARQSRACSFVRLSSGSNDWPLIRENPWNVTTHGLPDRCEPLLLEIAWLAADYCRKSESLLTNAVREDEYVPPEWQPDGCDAHECTEANAEAADRKAREILSRCDDETLAVIDRMCCALSINVDEV